MPKGAKGGKASADYTNEDWHAFIKRFLKSREAIHAASESQAWQSYLDNNVLIHTEKQHEHYTNISNVFQQGLYDEGIKVSIFERASGREQTVYTDMATGRFISAADAASRVLGNQ